MQRTYELMVLLHPDLEIDVESPISKIEGLVKADGGEVTRRDNWGKKRLAYRIARQDFAIYVYFEVKLDPEKVRELENALLITEEVLRHLVVVHEENKTRREDKDSDKAAADKEAEKPASDKPAREAATRAKADVTTEGGQDNG
jgi:small subunit ribosomal protein S6